MNTAPPLSKFTQFETDSVDVVRDAMTRAYCLHQMHVPRGQTKLAARHHQVTLSALSLNYLTYGTELAVTASELPDFFLVDFPIFGRCLYRLGARELTCWGNRGCIVSPGAKLRTDWFPDTELITLKVPRAMLEHRLADILERNITEPLRFEPEFDCSSGAAASLRALVDFLVTELDRHDAIRHSPLWCAQMERAVLMGLLTAQRHNYTDALETRISSGGPRYVQRAETFIRANLTDEIAVADIVAAAGVSERTLFAAYRKHKGLSPMAHHRALRLQAAREDLLHPAPHDTVSGIACRWGFYHLGYFARDYLQRFGERPSETLKTHS